MLKIKDYVKADNIEEAFELNQKKGNIIVAGTGWLKMTNRNILTAIDLSGLGLDKIEETKEAYLIGSMVTLRELETNQTLDSYGQGSIKEALHHIIGVQFRNCATVGGSIFSRFGFSDVLTNLMSFDSYVELYRGGIISLEEFVKMPKDNDILLRIILKKQPIKIAYQSFRNQSTDFPVLTCGASIIDSKLKIVIGARPSKAIVACHIPYQLQEMSEDKIMALATEISEKTTFQTNMRGSSEYRKHLSKTLIKRAILKMQENKF